MSRRFLEQEWKFLRQGEVLTLPFSDKIWENLPRRIDENVIPVFFHLNLMLLHLFLEAVFGILFILEAILSIQYLVILGVGVGIIQDMSFCYWNSFLMTWDTVGWLDLPFKESIWLIKLTCVLCYIRVSAMIYTDILAFHALQYGRITMF